MHASAGSQSEPNPTRPKAWWRSEGEARFGYLYAPLCVSPLVVRTSCLTIPYHVPLDEHFSILVLRCKGSSAANGLPPAMVYLSVPFVLMMSKYPLAVMHPLQKNGNRLEAWRPALPQTPLTFFEPKGLWLLFNSLNSRFPPGRPFQHHSYCQNERSSPFRSCVGAALISSISLSVAGAKVCEQASNTLRGFRARWCNRGCCPPLILHKKACLSFLIICRSVAYGAKKRHQWVIG